MWTTMYINKVNTPFHNINMFFVTFGTLTLLSPSTFCSGFRPYQIYTSTALMLASVLAAALGAPLLPPAGSSKCMSQFGLPAWWKINSFSPSLLGFSSSQWAESCYNSGMARSDAREVGARGRRQEERAGLLRSACPAEGLGAEWEQELGNTAQECGGRHCHRIQGRFSSDSRPTGAVLWGQGGISKNCLTELSFSCQCLEAHAGLGRKIKDWKSSKALSWEIWERSFPQGMAALGVWESQDLSGHERKRRLQGFKVAAVSQWREAELKSPRISESLKLFSWGYSGQLVRQACCSQLCW